MRTGSQAEELEAETVVGKFPSTDAHTRVDSEVLRGNPASIALPSADVELDEGRDLLFEEEATRMRQFAAVGFVMCLAGLLYYPVMAGLSPLGPMFVAALASLGAVLGWALWRLRNPQHYTRPMFRTVGTLCATAALCMLIYAGVFSPAIAIFTLGVVFIGGGDDRGWAVGICGAAIGIHALLSFLMAAGLIPDPGVFSSQYLPPGVLAFSIITNFSVLSVLLWQARMARAATRRAVDRLENALRVAQRREAQLEEAYNALKVARHANQGRLGRYTGESAGRFELAEVIGRGAMGEVYAAYHKETGESSAVKVLLQTGDPDQLRRFEREGEIMTRLDSPHVVKVFEVGKFGDDAPYLAMELLRGTDLSTMLRNRRMKRSDMIDMLGQVARGLDSAHGAGVIHRDIKPHNVFFCAGHGRPLWKILDFGVSRFGHSTGTLTEGAVVGTPGYMSPEQARGEEPDHRADIFSLGAVAYRCLTGQQPFSGPNLPQCLYEIVYNHPPRPSELEPELHEDVDCALALALAKSPDDRPAGASQLVHALELALAGRLPEEQRRRARELLASAPPPAFEDVTLF